MALTPEEVELLAQMEEQLADNRAQKLVKRIQSFRFRMWLAGCGLLAGIAVMLFGVTQANVFVGIQGFALMVCGVESAWTAFLER
jgi:fatty acid desaturase